MGTKKKAKPKKAAGKAGAKRHVKKVKTAKKKSKRASAKRKASKTKTFSKGSPTLGGGPVVGAVQTDGEEFEADEGHGVADALDNNARADAAFEAGVPHEQFDEDADDTANEDNDEGYF